MDIENKEPVVGFRVGTYVQGKTSVASINNISNVPQRMKDVVNVRCYIKITNLINIYIINTFIISIIYYNCCLAFSRFSEVI